MKILEIAIGDQPLEHARNMSDISKAGYSMDWLTNWPERTIENSCRRQTLST